MDIAEWIVNFIAFGMGLTFTVIGLFGIMMVFTLAIDGYNKIKD